MTKAFVRTGHLVATVLFVLAVAVAPADACDPVYRQLPEIYNSATDVFLGFVEESPFRSDGTVGDTPAGGYLARFSVRARYKGAPASEMLDFGASDCTFPFVKGQVYLVMGTFDGKRFITGQPFWPMKVDSENAIERLHLVEALKYVVARGQGQPQGFLRGGVMVAGRPAQASDNLSLRATRDDGTNVTVPVPNAPTGYVVALPPGAYRIDLLRDGSARASFDVSVLDGGVNAERGFVLDR